MARMPDYLERRGAVYYFRMPVPTDLHNVLGKVIRHSLRTKEFGEAKARVLQLAAQWAGTFEEARSASRLTSEDLDRAAWQHYSRELATDDAERQRLPTQADIEAKTQEVVADIKHQQIDPTDALAMVGPQAELQSFADKAKLNANRREARAKITLQHLTSGETILIEWAADDFIARNHLTIEKGSPEYKALCQRLQRAELQALDRTFERDRGNFDGKPSDPTLVPIAGEGRAKVERIESVMDLYDRYSKENPNGVRPETLIANRRDVQLFVDYAGPSISADKITRKLVSDFKALLFDYPSRAALTNAFQGLTPQEVVQANQSIKKPTLNHKTINKILSSLSGFCAWLDDNGRMSGNPVIGLMKKPKGVNASEDDRVTFTVPQLATLFTSPLFVGSDGPADWTYSNEPGGKNWTWSNVPGDRLIRDHRYWIWLVMLFSGARPAEVAQLNLSDFSEANGIWYMDIADLGEQQRVKRNASRRRVPIHSELIRLGFRQYFEETKRGKNDQLFPEIIIPDIGQIAAQFSRESNRHLVKIGVKENKRLVTYSLRHTFIDQARLGGFMNEHIALIVGHESLFGPRMSIQTENYGQVQHGTIEYRKSIVESVSYPGLNLDHLLPR